MAATSAVPNFAWDCANAHRFMNLQTRSGAGRYALGSEPRPEIAPLMWTPSGSACLFHYGGNDVNDCTHQPGHASGASQRHALVLGHARRPQPCRLEDEVDG